MPDVAVSVLISLLIFVVWLGAGRLTVIGLPAIPDTARAVGTGLWFSVAGAFPFWAFGAASAIGWYDAYDAIIPYELFRARFDPDSFNHAFAGGSTIESMFFLGGSPWSLYVFLIGVAGPQIGSLLFTIGASFTLFMGVYWTGRIIFRLQHGPSVYGALTALFVTQYAQTGVLAGLGWNFSLMVWLGLLALVPMSGLKRITSVMLLAIIASGTTTIGFFLPIGLSYILGLMLAAGSPWRRTIVENLIPAALFGMVVVVSNAELLRNMVAHGGESSRLLGIRNADALEAWAGGAGQVPRAAVLDTIGENLSAASSLYMSGAQLLSGPSLARLSLPPTFFFLVTLAVGLALFPARLWRICLALGLLVLAALGLTPILGQTNLPVASTFRWNELFMSTVPLLGLGIAITLAETDARIARWRPLVSAWLVGLLTVSMGILAHGSLLTIPAYGGWRILGGYEQAVGGVTSSDRQRAATFNMKSVAGVFNGVDVLDGMRQNFSPARTAFWFLSLHSTPIASWHTHRHALPPSWNDIDVDMLRMANVGMILSSVEIDSGEIELVSRQESVSLAQSESGVWTEILTNIGDITVLPALNIYRLEGAWPRVFVPAQVRQSEYNLYDRRYYQDLKGVGHQELLLPSTNRLEPIQGNSPIAIGRPAVTQEGMHIATSGSGVLVYNQEYTSDWRAGCENGENLTIHAVNAIMMAVAVPEGCGQLSFSVYEDQ